MTNWDLPLSITIGDKEYEIRNKCDYRVILDVIQAFQDDEPIEVRAHCCIIIFFEHPEELPDPLNIKSEAEADIVSEILKKISLIINCGSETSSDEPDKPKLMDWEHDFANISVPISRVLGYSVRDKNNYTHWYDFIGAYGEIGECYWSQVMNIRSKRMKGKVLDKSEIEFYKNHKQDIDLPNTMMKADQEWLDSDW